MLLTRLQREAIYRLYKRDRRHVFHSYRDFRRTVQPMIASDPCVIVPQFGMYIGVEPDGYTHT